jgi:periplasmic protein TonB
MHFSHLNDGSGTKAGKFALVAGIHVLVGVLFVHSLNTRSISLPKLTEQVLVLIQPELPPPPPPPPEPPRPTPRAAPPQVVVPPVEVAVPPPQEVPQVQATTQPDPAPQQPAQPQSDAAPAQASANTGAMRTAVLADPDGCAKPDYPARSARNGDTGTVTLALLVGADGRVTSSRIEHSSGFRELDRAAVNALSLCKFKPAMNNGVPEAGWGQIAYVWTLE